MGRREWQPGVLGGSWVGKLLDESPASLHACPCPWSSFCLPRPLSQNLLHPPQTDWLKEYLAHTTAQLRSHLSADQLAELAARDAADAARDPNPVPTRQRLPGRQSGSETWVASRGEGGGDKAGAADEGPAAAGPPLVRYRLAGDEGVAARLPGRLTGGAVRASGQNGEAEAAVRALDGDPATKWLDFGGGAPGAVPWLEYCVRGGAGKAGVEVARYVLTAGNDAPARDPKAVALEGQRPGSSGGWRGHFCIGAAV